MMEPAEAKDHSEGRSYFRTLEDARREVRERRRSGVDDDLVVRVERSGYGGYIVRCFPVDMLVEEKPILRGRGRPLYADK